MFDKFMTKVEESRKTALEKAIQALKKCLIPPIKEREEGKEKGPEFYNKTFHEGKAWKKHYTDSPYYFLWTVIIDRTAIGEKASVRSWVWSRPISSCDS